MKPNEKLDDEEMLAWVVLYGPHQFQKLQISGAFEVLSHFWSDCF